MKTLYSFLLGLACMGCAVEDTFTLTGVVPEGFRGTQLVVVREEIGKTDTLAFCKAVPGERFELKGKAINKLVSLPALGWGGTLFYAEPGNYYLEENGDYFFSVIPKQEGVQSRLVNGLTREFEANQAFMENSKQLAKMQDPEDIAKGEARYLELMHEIEECFFETLKTFRGQELAVDLLYEKLEVRLNYSYITHCLEAMGEVPATPKMDSIINYYNQLKARQPFGKAPAFTLPDTEGKMVSLSDYAGKYVLVNFWSSTCAPCRIKMRTWQREIDRLEKTGVEIISISCDRQKENWLKAIEHDKVSWTQLLEGDDMKVSQAYGMEFLSDSYLISPEGNVIGKNLSWEQIEDIVKIK